MTASTDPPTSLESHVASQIARRNLTASGALIGYLPAGFPDLKTSIDAAVALAENGVDVIELGIPYSDPVMDGPVIQAATASALDNGFKISHAFDAVSAITERVTVPVLAMTYWNPVLQYGVESFARDWRAAGGVGVITPDLIPDEAEAWLLATDTYALDRVFLAAPSSSRVRLDRIIRSSRGFVYAASTMGITGTRHEVDRSSRVLVDRLRALGAPHPCVGLGISTPQQVSEVLGYADGAIVGSVLVRALAEKGVSGVASVASALSRGTVAAS